MYAVICESASCCSPLLARRSCVVDK